MYFPYLQFNLKNLIITFCLAIGLSCLLLATASAANIVKQHEQDVLERHNVFSKQLLHSLENHDKGFFITHFDSHTFSKRVNLDIKISGGNGHIYKVDSIKKVDVIITNLLKKLGENAKWKLLRVSKKTIDARKYITSLYRIDMGDDGLSYWEFFMSADTESIRIVDVFNHNASRFVSETMGNIFRLASREYMKKPVKSSHKTTKPLIEFFQAIRKGRNQAAIKFYDHLPKHLKADPIILLMRMDSAANINEDLQMQALDDLAKYHGNDPKFSFVLIDYYFSRKEYEKAHKAIDTFRKMVGEDSALYSLHANVSYKQHRYNESLRYGRKAVELDPDYEDTYWMLLNNLIITNRFDDAVLVLEILEQRFFNEFEPKEFAKTDGFGLFAKSHQFSEWAKGK